MQSKLYIMIQVADSNTTDDEDEGDDAFCPSLANAAHCAITLCAEVF